MSARKLIAVTSALLAVLALGVLLTPVGRAGLTSIREVVYASVYRGSVLDWTPSRLRTGVGRWAGFGAVHLRLVEANSGDPLADIWVRAGRYAVVGGVVCAIGPCFDRVDWSGRTDVRGVVSIPSAKLFDSTVIDIQCYHVRRPVANARREGSEWIVDTMRLRGTCLGREPR